ncbi:MAG TPA: metallophosphoesterase [Candidatus Nanoarchaeia archaeon]|nr:metallophosphoesterase [Candidatus Nanoarchaeia archaeon]
MTFRLLFSSDLHGNEIQYNKFFKFAEQISADILILGGDISPKDKYENFIENQREFFKYKLQEKIKQFKRKSPKSNIYLMMGNDDCAVNLDVLDNPDLYQNIHGKRLKINDNFDIVGYSFVPITPFKLKDWEKFDMSNVPIYLKEYYEYRKKVNYRLDGFKSTKDGWVDFLFDNDMEKSVSIQKDLENEIFTKNAGKTVYVIHTPPNNTNLDQTIRKDNVGSIAVRLFIEKYQPYLTLHGHIHETVDVSGKFKDIIGNTLCMASGNHNVGEDLAVIVLDLDKPGEAKRFKI